MELAIAEDTTGDPQAALTHLIPALMLRPENGPHWQSLEVILRRLGRLEEARLAAR